jgi:hypothetical protein
MDTSSQRIEVSTKSGQLHAAELYREGREGARRNNKGSLLTTTFAFFATFAVKIFGSLFVLLARKIRAPHNHHQRFVVSASLSV